MLGLDFNSRGMETCRGSIPPLWRAAVVAPEVFTALSIDSHVGKPQPRMTPAGLEPAIPGSVGRCLIHWATGPSGGIDAQAMLTAAKAEAEANSLKQKTITPMLLQLEWINKWNGKLPETMLGDKTNSMIGIK